MNTLSSRPVLRAPRQRSTPRELMLAAACCELKSTVVQQQTRLTRLEEAARGDAAKIADLLRRNQVLTAAVHRTACAG